MSSLSKVFRSITGVQKRSQITHKHTRPAVFQQNFIHRSRCLYSWEFPTSNQSVAARVAGSYSTMTTSSCRRPFLEGSCAVRRSKVSWALRGCSCTSHVRVQKAVWWFPVNQIVVIFAVRPPRPPPESFSYCHVLFVYNVCDMPAVIPLCLPRGRHH